MQWSCRRRNGYRRRGRRVMHDHAPAGWRAQEHVGGDGGAAWLGVVTDGDMLDRALNCHAYRFECDDLFQVERELGLARKKLLPARTHGVIAHQARTSGM